MKENSDEIKLIEMSRNMENEFQNNPSLRNEFQNFMTQKNKENNGNEKHCVICGDNENIVKLIEIPNHEHENKNLCQECYSNQKKMGTKFSNIKNGKSYIMKIYKKN
jgi:exonuclease III